MERKRKPRLICAYCGFDPCHATCGMKKQSCRYCAGHGCQKCLWTGCAPGKGFRRKRKTLTRYQMQRCAVAIMYGYGQSMTARRVSEHYHVPMAEIDEFNLRCLWIEHVLHMSPYENMRFTRIEASILFSESCR